MNKKKIKVLHLLQSSRYSGAENVVCQIINMFNGDDNIEMIYCSADGQIRDTLKEKKITFVPMKKLSLSEVKRVIRETKPDVIHAHDMKASFVAALCRKHIKLIAHIHNSDFKARKISAKAIAFLLASKLCERVIWVSDSCLSSYRFSDFVKDKSIVLNNVINQQEILFKAKEFADVIGHDVVYVGRLEEPKNPQRLIRIVAKVKKANKNVSVGIVGSGSLEQDVRNLIRELQIEENVTLYGHVNNPLGILKNSKVMVITSDREGLPMVSLEAMALGVPIVSTPIDGLCDIVENDVNGYLVDDEDVFANKVLEIIDDDSVRAAFSNGVLKTFGRINDIDTYKSNLEGIYYGT